MVVFILIFSTEPFSPRVLTVLARPIGIFLMSVKTKGSQMYIPVKLITLLSRRCLFDSYQKQQAIASTSCNNAKKIPGFPEGSQLHFIRMLTYFWKVILYIDSWILRWLPTQVNKNCTWDGFILVAVGDRHDWTHTISLFRDAKWHVQSRCYKPCSVTWRLSKLWVLNWLFIVIKQG